MTVLRWHANPDARLRESGDNIDDHQIRVMALCHSLAATIGLPLVGTDLLKAARHHDEAERVVGDVPGPAKRRFKALASALEAAEAEVREEMGLSWRLSPVEAQVLDLADKLDAWQHARSCGVSGAEWHYAELRLRDAARRISATEWLEREMQR
jgi:5'-deoxynucleotidase YfbR-like HD superfamily hydrolase